MKILIVDDDKIILQTIAHSLKNSGYEVETVENGFAALNVLEKQKIDLIISDVMMPDISGLGLLSLLKQFYYNRIPVIIISSLDKTDIILHSMGLGAIDFVAKPIDFKELLSLVKKYDVESPLTKSNK
jgi:DNA-binding response OmpR family regulator